LNFMPKVIAGNVRQSPFFSYRAHNRIAWGSRPESGIEVTNQGGQVASCL
jgi:hypothetical protein